MKKSIFMMSVLLGGILPMSQALAQSWWDKEPREVRREINERIHAIQAPIPSVHSIENILVQSETKKIPLRIYSPREQSNLPVIMLIHGGAWVAGDLDTHDNLARYLCSQAGVVVISVGYLNAPEKKFPTQLNQCYDVLKWIQSHSQDLGVDISKLAVVGDSAGGNIAAALCLMIRDHGGPKIQLQVLINPAVDLSCNGTLERQGDPLDMFRWLVVQYVKNSTDVDQGYASPLKAVDLHNLPPAAIIVAEHDMLRLSAEQYAQRLIASDVSTFLYCQPGVDHLAGHGAKASLLAKESLDVAVERIKKALFKEHEK